MNVARQILVKDCKLNESLNESKVCEAVVGQKVLYLPGSHDEGRVGLVFDIEDDGKLSVKVGGGIRTGVDPSHVKVIDTGSKYV